jgi:hypothetical protein
MARNWTQSWPNCCQILILGLALLRPGLHAQSSPCSPKIIPVTVTDPVGKPVLGLTANDFVGRFQGRPVAILSASIDTSPRRIVLLLDASGSMLESRTKIWEAALTIARDLVESLPPEPSIAFLVFSSQVEWKADLTQDRRPILEEIYDLESGKKALKKRVRRTTALWDSVLQALRLFGTPRIGDTIYAITDGGDNQSRADVGKVGKALLNAGVRFFAVLPPFSDLSRPSEEQSGPGNLRELTAMTGGFFLAPYTNRIGDDAKLVGSAQLRVELDLLYSWTFQFYRLEIQPTQPNDKIRDWKLALVDRTQGVKANLRLGYPHKIFPCEAGSSAR